MQRKILIIAVLMLMSFTSLFAQHPKQDSSFKKYFVGSTLFMLGNFDSKNKPDFVQLNFGHRINKKNTVSVELKIWKYAWPLGIPYGKSFEAPAEKFPGYIREKGVAVAYQYFWWKGLYTGVHVMNAWQGFYDDNKRKIGNGFQIFNTYRAGYHVKFLKNRFFVEPSLAVTHRPFHTKMPAAFKLKDDKWSKFFFGEPGLHLGYNFGK